MHTNNKAEHLAYEVLRLSRDTLLIHFRYLDAALGQFAYVPISTLISSYAFFGYRNLKKITLSGNLRKIAKLAFSGCPDLKISAPAGSYAMRYAIRNQIPNVTVQPENLEM